MGRGGRQRNAKASCLGWGGSTSSMFKDQPIGQCDWAYMKKKESHRRPCDAEHTQLGLDWTVREEVTGGLSEDWYGPRHPIFKGIRATCSNRVGTVTRARDLTSRWQLHEQNKVPHVQGRRAHGLTRKPWATFQGDSPLDQEPLYGAQTAPLCPR